MLGVTNLRLLALLEIEQEIEKVQREFDAELTRMEQTPVDDRTDDWRAQNDKYYFQYVESIKALAARQRELKDAWDEAPDPKRLN